MAINYLCMASNVLLIKEKNTRKGTAGTCQALEL
jgi:hypothetical protein